MPSRAGDFGFTIETGSDFVIDPMRSRLFDMMEIGFDGARRSVAMQDLRWWQIGLLGGFALSAATLIKIGRAIVRGFGGQPFELVTAVGLVAATFGMGFVCGVVGWSARGLSRRFGMVGDAIVAVVILVVFFVCCMLLFEPALLGAKFRSGGAPMLGFAVLLGLICGPWVGRDLRKEFGSPEPQEQPPGSESGTEDRPFEVPRRPRGDGFGL